MIRRTYGDCSFAGCPQDANVKKTMLCSAHQSQALRGLTLTPLKYIRQEPGAVCSFSNCDRYSKSKGLCHTHYSQALKGKPLTPLSRDGARLKHRSRRERADLSCRFDGCGRPVTVVAQMLCISHYSQHNRGKELTMIDKGRSDKSIWIECGAGNCSKPMNPNRLICTRCHDSAKRFSLRHEAYVALTANPICKVCHATENIHIDHDHSCCPTAGVSCGKCVRGLLCSRCNWVLGNVSDDINLMLALIDYLKEPPEKYW
jgi:Recombination endonuclease VII